MRKAKKESVLKGGGSRELLTLGRLNLHLSIYGLLVGNASMLQSTFETHA